MVAGRHYVYIVECLKRLAVHVIRGSYGLWSATEASEALNYLFVYFLYFSSHTCPLPSRTSFLCATAGTAIARLSHRNSVRLSVCHTGGSGKNGARSSPSAAPKTLVSGSVTLFQKFHRGHPNRGP